MRKVLAAQGQRCYCWFMYFIFSGECAGNNIGDYINIG